MPIVFPPSPGHVCRQSHGHFTGTRAADDGEDGTNELMFLDWLNLVGGFNPFWKILDNGKDYPIYYGK